MLAPVRWRIAHVGVIARGDEMATIKMNVPARQLAELLYDIFRSAPIPCKVNGGIGKVAFFSRDAQIAQATQIIEKLARRAGKKL
jgi:hypothetical protein